LNSHTIVGAVIWHPLYAVGWFMTAQSDPEESLTHEEILFRFKKVLGRDMAPEERHLFFLLPEPPERKPDPQK
jgi:hypothetical protein